LFQSAEKRALGVLTSFGTQMQENVIKPRVSDRAKNFYKYIGPKKAEISSSRKKLQPLISPRALKIEKSSQLSPFSLKSPERYSHNYEDHLNVSKTLVRGGKTSPGEVKF